MSTQATLNLGNLVIILVADGAVSDFAGTAKALQGLVADAEVFTHRLPIDPIIVERTLLLQLGFADKLVHCINFANQLLKSAVSDS